MSGAPPSFAAAPSRRARLPVAAIATGLVVSVLCFVLWLPAAYLISGWLLREPAVPPASRILWSLPGVCLCACLALYFRARARFWWYGAGAVLLPALLGLWTGWDGALPAFLTLSAAAMLPVGAWRALERFLARRQALGRGIVTAAALLLAAELALQGVALGVGSRTGPRLDPAAADDLSILCLGDSFTYGLGASSRENAWPGRLEAGLRASLPGRSVSVLNAGQPGRNSSALLAWLRRELPRLRPDVVLVSCGTNNQWDLREVEADRLAGLTRRETWRLGMQRAALALRLYRLFRLREVRFAATAETDLPFGLRVEYLDPQREAERIAALERSVSENPSDAPSWKELAIRLCRLARNPEALSAVDRALQLRPDDSDLWNLRGWILCYLRRGPEAVLAFDRAVALGQPTDDYFLCISFAFQFDEDAALAHLRALREGQPALAARLPLLDRDFFRERRYLQILYADLGAMRELCLAAGALMYVHDYPYPGPISACLRDFGRSHDCFLVSHSEHFDRLRAEGEAEGLFVYDGHCSDEGYRVMADLLLPPLLAALRAHGLVEAVEP